MKKTILLKDKNFIYKTSNVINLSILFYKVILEINLLKFIIYIILKQIR